MSAVTQAPLPVSSTSSQSRPALLVILTVITAILTVVGLLMLLFYAGLDVTQGDVQRIFYIHVSAFAGASVALGVSVVAGIMYLWKRNPKWDRLALSGIEVGFALALTNLITGMVWARPIWNTWWTWDPRLTSAAIMILTYAAYFMLRAGIENPETRRRLSSVYGILAYTTVIVTFVIIRIRPDTIHPAVIGPSPQNAEGGFELSSSMLATMSFNMIVWSVFIPWVLIWWRLRIENLSERVNALRAVVAEK
ncbi:MAG: heme exporter protein CcmC [Chloroflexi bacterium OLB15]|nr:MAG: heme exporter protein CcmC [Chloroflexi bacterium OLB15]